MDIEKEWKVVYKNRKRYSTSKREPFFKIAKKYLPVPNDKSLIVDIGCGRGDFIKKYVPKNYWPNCYLLDGSKHIINELRTKFPRAILYSIPDPLPFEDKAINFIHCSHVIEHLDHWKLFYLLSEINRVLIPNGTLVISSPLLAGGWFYGDLDHIKPYPPGLIIRLLCDSVEVPSMNPSSIRGKFELIENVPRYYAVDPFEKYGFKNIFLDLLYFMVKKIFHKLGFRKYLRTGYTLVLKKEMERWA